MEITEEQRKRAEANRLAALAKRNQASAAMKQDPWMLFKCRKISNQTPQFKVLQAPEKPFVDRFLIVLEICSPDAFSVTPEPVPDFPFPGEIECLRKLDATLASVVPFRSFESQSGRGSYVCKLKDYDVVSKCLKKFPGIQLQEIPWKTLAVVQKFSYSFVGDCWIPCMPNHLSDDEVNALIKKLPQILRDSLLPFQLDGIRYGLQRGGHCLIADEMGLGKTLQAIAIACCFMNEGPILVVCPAILRFSWAEELERWLPFCLPTDIHLVFGHQNNVIYLSRCPKVVVISYTMLHRLRKSMLERKWSLMIVDESHNVRCTKKKSESEETKAVLDVASKVKRIILLSGTPSLSRPYDIFHQINMLWPGLLGKDKYEFAKNYCSIKFVRGSQGKIFKDFSNGVRLEELNVLLKQTVMIRRLKEHVLVQLPPKRRQIIRLVLKVPNIIHATTASEIVDMVCMDSRHQGRSRMNSCSCEHDSDGDQSSEDFKEWNGKDGCFRTPKQLSYQEIGIAKLSGFREWLSNHPTITELDGARNLDMGFSSPKMLIFAHHLKVLDGVQEFASEKGIGFVRIDGSTLSRDRQAAVQAFHSSAEVKIAIIGITAGGVGLDFSSAQNVVFLELPKSASEMLQAEDRAHRRGQTNAVNIYIFCAKDTSDESHWQHLNRSLYCVSSMTNGKDGAIKEIEVDRVCNLERMNFHNTALDLRVQAIQTYTETSEKYETRASEQVEADVNNVIQTDALPFKVDRVTDSNSTEDSVAYGSPGVVSACKFDNSDNKNDRLENIPREAIASSNTEPTSSQNISVNWGLMDDKVCIKSGKGEGRASELIEANVNNSIRTDLLRFEVSRYTGRVHLYACLPGKDSRPRPLFENFRSEELESKILSSTDINKETAPKLINENPVYWNVLLAFIKEWNDLRPIERNKLLGKPLQMPLNLELCYLRETLNHGFGGLLKGGSKRRVTPICDISHPLPENAVWKKISLRTGSAKKEKEYSQAWTKTDEPLCKLCQTPCKGELAKEPEYFEDLFCNLTCFDEYRIRTSQRSLREALFQIEHGVCTQCKLDCHKLVDYIRPLSIARRQEYIEKVAPKVANHKNVFDKLVYEPTEGNAWHADHIVPVYRGGGECRLENMRTLCVACHSEVTAAQRAERHSERMKAKEQLKLVMAEIKGSSSTEQNESNLLVHEHPEVVEGAVEDELLIKVPGSAYSSGKNTATETN